MRFSEWKKLREVSDTTTFDPNQPNTQGFELGQGAAFSNQPNTWAKLAHWYDKYYQNFGGWAAVEKMAGSDPETKSYLDTLKQQAASFKPEVEPNGADDESWATEEWIDKVTKKLADHMQEKNAGTATTKSFPAVQHQPADNTGVTQTFHGQVPAPPPGQPLDQQDLAARVKKMEDLLSRLHPELFQSV